MKGILLLTSFIMLTTSCTRLTSSCDEVSQTPEIHISETTTLASGELEISTEMITKLNVETVSIEEFTHSEYMLMVEEETYASGAEYVPENMYAFLGDGIYTLHEGRELYGQINEIYSKTYPNFEVIQLPSENETIEKFNKYFFERRVIQVSEDGQRVLCFSYQDNEENKEVYDRGRWNTVFEVFEGNELIYSYKQDEGSYADKQFISHPNLKGCFFVSLTTERENKTFYHFEDKTEIKMHVDVLDEIIFNGKEYFSLSSPDSVQDSFDLYSLLDENLINTYKCKAKYLYRQLLENGKVLAIVPTNIVKDESDAERTILWDAYLMNIDGTEEVCLGSVFFDSTLSPDGKYLAYRGPVWYELDDPILQTYYSEVPMGYYIKNLATNETIFYSTDCQDYKIIGWAQKEGVDNLVDSFGN